MQKAFGKKSVIFMFLFPAFLIYTAFVIVSIVWAGYYSFFDWSNQKYSRYVEDFLSNILNELRHLRVLFSCVNLERSEPEWH